MELYCWPCVQHSATAASCRGAGVLTGLAPVERTCEGSLAKKDDVSDSVITDGEWQYGLELMDYWCFSFGQRMAF